MVFITLSSLEVNIHCIYADSTCVGDNFFFNVCNQSHCKMTLGIGRKLRRSLLIPVIILILYTAVAGYSLRWPNTVFARALVDAIQHVHKDCKNKHVVDTALI